MKILVLAGGTDQIALINELKSRGHYVILADYYQNPPAKKYADKHIVANTLELARIEEIAVLEKVDLVCTACTDQALLTVAYVSEKLGLPCYLDYKTGLNVTNKSYMKSVLTTNGIPTAKYVVIGKEDHLSSLKDFKYPIVVKPVDCNSSKGVKRVDKPEECDKYIKEAIEYSRTKTAIVEEYKEGDEISADFYIEHGVAKLLSATKSQKIKNRNSFTILSSIYPAVNSQQEKELVCVATNIAKAFSLDNTPLLVQLIVNDKEINVIEFSARMGGGSKYKLIQVLSGVNIMSKYVDRVLGQYPELTPLKQVDYAQMVYVYCHPGIFEKIEGLESLKEDGIVDEFFIYKTKGMEIGAAETSGDRPAGYLCTGCSEKELREKVRKANKRIKVISTAGNDIMIHSLLN